MTFNVVSNILFTINNSHFSTENNSSNFFHGSLSLFYTVCTQFVYGYLICRLNTRIFVANYVRHYGRRTSIYNKYLFVLAFVRVLVHFTAASSVCVHFLLIQYSVPATSFPSTIWSETCTTTLILLTSVIFGTIWGGGCNMHFYLRQ